MSINKAFILTFSLWISFCTFVVADDLFLPCRLPDPIEYTLDCFGEAQKGKQLVLVSKNGYGECELEKIDLFFDLYQKNIQLPEARSLITDLVATLLQQINAQKKLTNYFSVFPLTVDEIVIRIRVRNEDCGFVYPLLGNIVYITAMDGLINYGTLNSYTYRIDNLTTEHYASPSSIQTSPLSSGF